MGGIKYNNQIKNVIFLDSIVVSFYRISTNENQLRIIISKGHVNNEIATKF